MSSDLSPPLSSSTMSVEGRVFLVTGGTQGLGLAVARKLRDAGASMLFLVSRSRDKGSAAERELSNDACRAVYIHADLASTDDVDAVLPTAESHLAEGQYISGLVNAAAITDRGNLFTTTSDLFDRLMAINVRAPFLLTQAVARHIQQRSDKHSRTDSIVNISSVAALGGAPFMMVYSMTKAALVTLTKNNAAELAPHGIRVNAINMGWTLTDNEDRLRTSQSDSKWIERADSSVPLGRILRPDDIAATVLFLLSNASSMITGNIVEQHPEHADGMLSHETEDSA